MKNKIVRVAVIHTHYATFPCGIIYDIDEEHIRKLIDYIIYNTGISFSGLMTADLESNFNPLVYADGSDEIYLLLHRTMNLQ